MQHPSNHLFDHTPESLLTWTLQRGLPKFRAKQILEWVYEKGIADPAQMSNLSKRDRDLLLDPVDGLTTISSEIVTQQKASDGTQKLLLQWQDFAPPSLPASSAATPTSLQIVGPGAAKGDSSRQTECVMIPVEEQTNELGDTTKARRTACISSQVGCPVGCKFCASGIGGLDGNLSAGRIVEQVWRLARLPGVERISNVVFMGMGEPLSNFQNVTSAIRTICAPWGMGISARKVTISTVGLPKAIERLANELELPVTLALSLHAPNDDIRRQLIPWAEYTTIAELLKSCQMWFNKTGREITLEYIMLGGVNDQEEHAHQLAHFAQTLRANINLIRYNEVKGMPFIRPKDEDVRAFQGVLRDRHINVHIRASRGRDIAAACGQLRHESTSKVA